jgi:hypothetical protein
MRRSWRSLLHGQSLHGIQHHLSDGRQRSVRRLWRADPALLWLDQRRVRHLLGRQGLSGDRRQLQLQLRELRRAGAALLYRQPMHGSEHILPIHERHVQLPLPSVWWAWPSVLRGRHVHDRQLQSERYLSSLARIFMSRTKLHIARARQARGEPPSFARRGPSREGLETLPGFPSQSC